MAVTEHTLFSCQQYWRLILTPLWKHLMLVNTKCNWHINTASPSVFNYAPVTSNSFYWKTRWKRENSIFCSNSCKVHPLQQAFFPPFLALYNEAWKATDVLWIIIKNYINWSLIAQKKHDLINKWNSNEFCPLAWFALHCFNLFYQHKVQSVT